MHSPLPVCRHPPIPPLQTRALSGDRLMTFGKNTLKNTLEDGSLSSDDPVLKLELVKTAAGRSDAIASSVPGSPLNTILLGLFCTTKRVKLKQGLANSRLAHFLIQSLVNPTHHTCNSRYYLFFKLLDAQVTDKFLTTQ